MALKEPTHQQLIEALDCAMEQWRIFGEEIINTLKQYPYSSIYLKPLVKTYNECCVKMREQIDLWLDVPSQENHDI